MSRHRKHRSSQKHKNNSTELPLSVNQEFAPPHEQNIELSTKSAEPKDLEKSTDLEKSIDFCSNKEKKNYSLKQEEFISRICRRQKVHLPTLINIGLEELPSNPDVRDWSMEHYLANRPDQPVISSEFDLRPSLADLLRKTADPYTLIYNYRAIGRNEISSMNNLDQSGRILMKSLLTEKKIDGYGRVHTILGLKQALIYSGPCYISFPSFIKEVGSEHGVFWKPTNIIKQQSAIGGRRGSVVGYNDQGFIVNLNDSGEVKTCIYPYVDWGYHWEIWSMINQDPMEPDVSYGWFSFLTNLWGN